MGFQKSKRPILAPKGGKFSSDITLTTAGSSDAGIRQPIQTIAPSGASGVHATSVTARGVTFINSTGTGAGWTLNLVAPPAAGIEKTIAINPASTVPVTVRTASSSHAFYGSTANAVSASTVGTTGNIVGKAKVVKLLSVSTSQWAVQSVFPVATTGSTFVTLLGATA